MTAYLRTIAYCYVARCENAAGEELVIDSDVFARYCPTHARQALAHWNRTGRILT